MDSLRKILGSVVVGTILLTGCGDDSDVSATGGATAADTQAFCRANAELDGQGRAPSGEELQGLSDLAPPEIESEVDLVAERVTAEGVNAFDDPAIQKAVEDIDSWRATNCAAAG